MLWIMRIAILALLGTGLPLTGAWLAGLSLTPYLDFPPIPVPRATTAFSWWVFVTIALLTLCIIGPFAWRIVCASVEPASRAHPRGRFPAWGWLGVTFVSLSWLLAWNRFPWFAQMQPHTFVPIWLGFVLVINALTMQRKGECMLANRTGYYLALFPVSALFWWSFEYLNLFAQNWYYEGSVSNRKMEGFLSSTLAFATVLPAVLGTREWLSTFPRLSAGLNEFWRVSTPAATWVPHIALLAGMLGLLGIGIAPDLTYPMLWISPLLLMVALERLLGRGTILQPILDGAWSALWLAALAGLVCGFFWELWNAGSLAQWHYALPNTDRFRLFEMPILGYAGYIPFGVTCAVAADFFLNDSGRRSISISNKAARCTNP